MIHISVEEYLDLTDQDIQYLLSVNAGDHATSPWYGSSISKKRKQISEDSDEDIRIDFQPEDEDRSHGDNPASLEESLEDYVDLPEEPEI